MVCRHIRQAFLAHPLAVSFALTLLLLVAAIPFAYFVATFSTDISATIQSETESVRIRNLCGDKAVDVLLPEGRIIAYASTDPSSKIDFPTPEATAYRLQGRYEMVVHRRRGEPLTVTIGSLPKGSLKGLPEKSSNDWFIQECGRTSCDVLTRDETTKDKKKRLLHFSYTSTTKDLAKTSIPVTGITEIGEPARSSYDLAGKHDAPYPMLAGTIRIRSDTWMQSGSRVEISEHPLDLGDVVRTHLPESQTPCFSSQADGFVRPAMKDDGALEAVVRVKTDSVTLARGEGVNIGASAVEKFSAHPVVAATWAGAVALFALIGTAVALFEVVKYNAESKDKESGK